MKNKSERIEYIVHNNSIQKLFSVKNKIDWLKNENCIYDIVSDGTLKVETDFQLCHSNQLRIKLNIHNSDKKDINVNVKFPILHNILSNVSYCYPSLNPQIGSETMDYKMNYGTWFPLQFMSVFFDKKECLSLITQDSKNHQKTYSLSKKTDGYVSMKVEYNTHQIKKGETWYLPTAIIDISDGDWHAGFSAYKKALYEWYNPLRSKKEWLQKAFNFRQYFLHDNYGDKSWDQETDGYILQDLIKKDIEAFGGIDYLQLFDWSSEPKHGRVGKYNPWQYLSGSDHLKNEIKEMQEKGIHVGLYFEGYLLDRKTDIAKLHGKEWNVCSCQRNIYSLAGDQYWSICPHIKDWKEYLISSIKRNIDILQPDGIYIDQYGEGTQYPCYNENHGHFIPNNQLQDENDVIKNIGNNIPDSTIILSEYCPTDVGTQYQDGSLTYAKGIVNLTRFVYQDFKQFVIIRCDEPLGTDLESINKIFLNGLGIWLSGPLSDLKWFPLEVRSLIRKTYGILKKYHMFFSGEATPMITTLDENIISHKFYYHGKNLWTLYNNSTYNFCGEVLSLKKNNKKQYYDVWNEKYIHTTLKNGYVYITQSIKSGEVGCIVETE